MCYLRQYVLHSLSNLFDGSQHSLVHRVAYVYGGCGHVYPMVGIHCCSPYSAVTETLFSLSLLISRRRLQSTAPVTCYFDHSASKPSKLSPTPFFQKINRVFYLKAAPTTQPMLDSQLLHRELQILLLCFLLASQGRGQRDCEPFVRGRWM